MRLSNKFIFASLLSLSISCPGFAFDLRHGTVPVQLGLFSSSQGKAQNINIAGLIGDQFTVTSNRNTNGLFGIGYYIDGMAKDRFNLSYGINGFYLGKMSVSGTIYQEHLYPNLGYSYAIQNIPVYLAAKANVKTKYERYSIILDAGIGPNFMNISQYNNTSLNGITVPDDAFGSHNSVAFSATVGIGLRLNNIFGNAPLECGYRFFYLGQGELSRQTDQLLNTLKTGNNFANAVVCAVTI